ncbi:MAG: LamG-like jellyroll fold domain-containing protein [Spirulina sp.]
MLIYPQAIMATQAAAFGTDYPALNSANAMAASCTWLAMPSLFTKDSHQQEPTLFGGATIDSSGLQVPNNGSAGAAWPSPSNFERINQSGQFSIAWFGRPLSYATDGMFLNAPLTSTTTISFTRLARAGNTAYGHTRWLNAANHVFADLYNSGQGDHIFANATQQYVLTFNGSTVCLYRNGALAFQGNFSPGVASSDTSVRHITLCNRSPDDLRNGIQAADVSLAALFDRALSLTEVQSLGSNPGQLILSNAPPSYDYPAISGAHSIGQDVVWALDATRFEKDSTEAEPLLNGAASFTTAGLTMANTWSDWAQFQIDYVPVRNAGQCTVWLDANITSWESWGDLMFESPDIGGWRIFRDASTADIVFRWPSSKSARFSNQVMTTSQALAITHDGGTVRLYRNGVLVATTSGQSIGTGEYGANRFGYGVNMVLRRAFVAKRSLSASEISSLYSNWSQFLLNP